MIGSQSDSQIHVFMNLFSSGPQGSYSVCNLIDRQMLRRSVWGKVERRVCMKQCVKAGTRLTP